MLRSTLTVALCFGFLGLAHAEPGSWDSYDPFPSTGASESNEQTNTGDGQKNPEGDLRGTSASPLIVNVLRTTNNEKEASESRDERNQAAFNELLLVIFNGLLAIATIGLFVATALLYDSTRKVANATVVAANAARDATDASAAVDSPRLIIDKIVLSVRTDAPSYVVTYNVVNIGRTPAMLRAAVADLRLFEAIPAAPAYREPTTYSSRVVIYERAPTEDLACTLNESDEPAAAGIRTLTIGKTGNEPDLLFYGYFQYRDVFRKTRTRGFGYLIDPIVNRRGIREAGDAYNYERNE